MPKGDSLRAWHASRRGIVPPATSSTYIIWRFMKDRCQNPKNKDFHRYGGRGITVCHRWQEFKNFYEDMGVRPDELSIDRIDGTKGYSPENCRWATKHEQARNVRTNRLVTWNGETKCVAQWAEDLGIDRKALQMRLNAWSVERSLTEPYVARKKANGN